MITNNFLALVGKNKTTSSDISKKTGIAGSTLPKFASEKSDIKLSTLIKICDYFGCELSDLIEYDPQIIN